MIVFSCYNDVRNEQFHLVLKNNYSYNKYKNTDTLFLEKKEINNKIFYNYFDNNRTNKNLIFSFYIEKDSIIDFTGIKYFLKKSKKYNVENIKYTVDIFFSDDENVVDDKSCCFYNKKYGLLTKFDLSWGLFSNTLYCDSISSQLVFKIINDSSNFSKY